MHSVQKFSAVHYQIQIPQQSVLSAPASPVNIVVPELRLAVG